MSPSITRVNLGEIASVMCCTDREAVWSLYNEKLSDNVMTSGTLNQHLQIDQIVWLILEGIAAMDMMKNTLIALWHALK